MQKSCIYRLIKEQLSGNVSNEIKIKYYQIRVKSIEFLAEQATAIYFYDFTHHMQSVKLEGEIIEQKARNKSLKESQVTVSHEFRTPLSSSLMLLENMLSNF